LKNTAKHQDTADNEEKAALLRAKLLEKHTHSRGPAPGQELSKLSATTTIKTPTEESLETTSALDSLVREARDAANRETQLKQSTNVWMKPDRIRQSKPNLNQHDDKSPSGLAGKTLEPSKQQSGKKNRSTEIFRSWTLDNRKTKKERGKGAIENMNNGASSTLIELTKHNAMSVADTPKSGSGVEPSHATEKAVRDYTIAPANHGSKTPSRSDTIVSTSTVQPDTMDKKDTLDQPGSALQIETVSDVTKVATNKDLTGFTNTLARSNDLPHADVISKGNDLPLSNASCDPAKYSHHFDDLDEWLEVTGYHDRDNRERVLGLYRRRAELERQMAEVERELEQSTVPRARSFQALQTVNSRAVAPPGTRTASIANVITSSSPTGSPKLATSGASIGGTKRARSPERTPNGPTYTDKQRRLSSSAKDNATLQRVNDAPSGPR
jgi:hypothetical protein